MLAGKHTRFTLCLLFASALAWCRPADAGLSSNLGSPSAVNASHLHSIPPDSVREAISSFLRTRGCEGLPADARLHWPESLPTKQVHVHLRVVSVAWDNRRQAAQFHLRCTEDSACTDFLVEVKPAVSLPETWQHYLGWSTSSASRAGSVAPGPILARRGQSAVLIMRADGIRVSMRVICTEAGKLHQRIRVFDQQSNRTFYADVVGEALLESSL
jgi:hypothetical protein